MSRDVQHLGCGEVALEPPHDLTTLLDARDVESPCYVEHLGPVADDSVTVFEWGKVIIVLQFLSGERWL